MYKSTIVAIILCGLCFVSISNAANVIYVDANGPNDPGTGTFDDPFGRIQDAIDASIDGDIIEIQPGVYSGPRNYELVPKGKSITIKSVNPGEPNIVVNTIIDPNGAGRGFLFDGEPNCTVSGLTITNGYTGASGGAIACYVSSPTISNCIFHNNRAVIDGGGIYCQDSNATIAGCIIRKNSTTFYGGGLAFSFGHPLIKNCLISDNNASYGQGGGIHRFNAGKCVLTNCTLVKNSATSGGALYCWGGTIVMNNSILWANDASQGPEIAVTPYSGLSGGVTASYSNVRGGEAMVYDPCNVFVWGDSNIDTNPLFASFDPNGDSEFWDLHLQSAYGRWDTNSQSWISDSNTSPCIDAGDPNSDWSSEPWPNGKRINMGTYGGTNQASRNGNPADFNIDRKVDFVDFAEFSAKWLAKVHYIEDLNDNGIVDSADLGMFAENWLWQRE